MGTVIVRQRKQQFAQHSKDNEFNNNTTQVSQTTPSNVCSRNVIPQAPNILKSCLKRLRSSPNDDDGCAALSEYLHLQKTTRHEIYFKRRLKRHLNLISQPIRNQKFGLAGR